MGELVDVLVVRGWMDGWKDGMIDVWMDACVHEQVDGYMCT